MFKILFITLLFASSIVKAKSSFHYLLGSEKQSLTQTLKTSKSLVWSFSNNVWSISSLQDDLNLSKLPSKDELYVLINNNEISYITSPYKKNYYEIKKGWNYLPSHENGLKIRDTFKSKDIEFVYTYDKSTQAWAGYSPYIYIQDLINTTRILTLKKIEPAKGFYVYAKKDTKVEIVSVEVNETCKKKMQESRYKFLLNSGQKKIFTNDENEKVAFKSRYMSHYKSGIYDESRLMIIYPKLDKKSAKVMNYGPAQPKSHIRFVKEHEGKEFFIFDFKDEKCYKGVFPSKLIPPFSSLQELK